MARPQFDPVFEEDESVILARILSKIPPEWRAEPGDFPYDMVVPAVLEIKQLQVEQDYVLRNSHPQFAEGIWFDYCLQEVGMNRFEATKSKRTLTIRSEAGVTIPKGYKISSIVQDSTQSPILFTVDESVTFEGIATVDVPITCERAGEVGNLANGTRFVLMPPLPGVLEVVDKGLTTPGADEETIEAAWDRYDFNQQHPDTGGNKNDYVRWGLEVAGVGHVRCIPRWNGNGTIKVVLGGDDHKPATPEVVAAAQAYLDPTGGLGDGRAPAEHHVTAVAAENLPINITATVSLAQGSDSATVAASFSAQIEKYLADLVFTDSPVVVARIGAMLINTSGVLNYSDLTINGGVDDIAVGFEEIATLGTVTI